ncbi:hypothetical protein [Streptomyces werraensis]|uniref:hypothetical protein n=1 Tax=Streptomyces werraensis TaxID=68284 RepID=UPI0037F1B789
MGPPPTTPRRIPPVPLGGWVHPARCARHHFEQAVQLLELFFHREGRAPTTCETIRVDGDTVNLGAWPSAPNTAPASSPTTTPA